MPISCLIPISRSSSTQDRRENDNVFHRLGLGQNDEIKLSLRAVEDIHDVAMEKLRLKAVDAKRARLSFPVELEDCANDVFSRRRLLRRRHRVLEIEEGDIRLGIQSFFDHFPV